MKQNNKLTNKLTIGVEREAMIDLLKRRECQTPLHCDPCWVHLFWSNRIMNNDRIKRILSVGWASLSDHLREYKDPFEPQQRELTLVPIDRTESASRSPGRVVACSSWENGTRVERRIRQRLKNIG